MKGNDFFLEVDASLALASSLIFLGHLEQAENIINTLKTNIPNINKDQRWIQVSAKLLELKESFKITSHKTSVIDAYNKASS